MPSALSAALRPIRLAALAFGLALPTAAAGADPELCEQAVAEASRQSGVPPAVLQAIALTETGRWQNGRLRPWPWAVNREGEGFWFASREEALAFARASLGEGRPSFDMGCFQINYHYHGRGFPSLDAMADPAAGALYAARFLRDLHGELGTWSAAAGAYHSRTPELANRYRQRFDRILAGLGGAPGAAPPAVAAPETRRPPTGTVRRVRAPRIITIDPSEASAAKEQAASADGALRMSSEPSQRPLPAGGRL